MRACALPSALLLLGLAVRARFEVLRRTSEARQRELHDLATLLGAWRLRCRLEHLRNFRHADDVEGERALADRFDTPVAELLAELEKRVRLAHARPGQRTIE